MKYTVLILSLFFSVAGFGQGQMFLRATAAAAGNLLLDDYPGAAAAYATVKLRAAADSCMVIRRDSDNATALIGFSGNNIDEAAINSHCSGVNCFVVRWSDQTGNGRDAVQATTTEQPKVYDSVTGVLSENSITALTFDGGDALYSSYSFAAPPETIFSVVKFNSSSGSYGRIFSHSDSGNDFQSPNFIPLLRDNGSARLATFIPSTIRATIVIGYNLQALVTNISISGQTKNVFNGTLQNTYAGNGSNTFANTSIGNMTATTTGNDGIAGSIQLLIHYTSDQSANQTAIETIINNYYSIY